MAISYGIVIDWHFRPDRTCFHILSRAARTVARVRADVQALRERPAFIRRANIAAANAARAEPPAVVLHMGQRRGPVWERYLRELSALVEWANARPEPVRLTEGNLLGCATQAVRS